MDLLQKHPIRFKIVRPRNSKLGDFKVNKATGFLQITINGNLNPYSFLVTTVHEFAHYIVYKKYGLQTKPHGDEWKREYAILSKEAIDYKELPKDVETAFINSLVSIKASCSDIELMRALKKYDVSDTPKRSIESISKNTTFVYQNREFILLEKRRTRFLCMEVSTQKRFTFHALTEIQINE
jgi:hypothetical protein